MKVLHYAEAANVSFRLPWMDLAVELRRKGAEPHVLCRAAGNVEAAAAERGIPVTTWKPWLTNFPPVNLRYPGILRRVRPDVVHTRLSSAANIAGFWGRRLGIPTVGMLDGAPKRKYYRNVDRFTACSAWARDKMAAQGVSPDIIDVVHNSIDIGRYARDESRRREFRLQNGLGPDEVVFVAAGSFSSAKGFDLLLDALSAVCRCRDGMKLLLAGDGPDRPLLLAAIERLGLRERVVVSDSYQSDIRPWLWGGDYFVLPSREEPFGIIVLEAMASGLPVIVTDSGGPAEILEIAGCGLLARSDDADSLADAMTRAMEMGEALRTKARNDIECRLRYFSGDSLAERLLGSYARARLERCI